MSGRQFSLPYQIPPVALLAPAADAAGRTSGYRTLKNALKAYVIFQINQGNAATIQLSLLQAQDVSGTGSKPLAATPIWLEADAINSDTPVPQPAAVGFTTSATIKDKIIIFEIEPEACMDIANGFRTIAVSTGASNAANITAAVLYVLQSYQGASAPSTLTN